MGYGPTKEAYKFTKSLIKGEEGPWYILHLPNKKWGALWYHGLEAEHAQGIYEGEYEESLAFIGEREEALEFVLTSLEELQKEDPLNYRYDLRKIRSKFSRKNSKYRG